MIDKSILCGGRTSAKATLVCTQTGCSSYAMVCGGTDCDCMDKHNTHSMRNIAGLDEALRTPLSLTEHHGKVAKSINGTIDRWIADLQKLRA